MSICVSPLTKSNLKMHPVVCIEPLNWPTMHPVVRIEPIPWPSSIARNKHVKDRGRCVNEKERNRGERKLCQVKLVKSAAADNRKGRQGVTWVRRGRLVRFEPPPFDENYEDSHENRKSTVKTQRQQKCTSEPTPAKSQSHAGGSYALYRRALACGLRMFRQHKTQRKRGKNVFAGGRMSCTQLIVSFESADTAEIFPTISKDPAKYIIINTPSIFPSVSENVTSESAADNLDGPVLDSRAVQDKEEKAHHEIKNPDTEEVHQKKESFLEESAKNMEVVARSSCIQCEDPAPKSSIAKPFRWGTPRIKNTLSSRGEKLTADIVRSFAEKTTGGRHSPTKRWKDRKQIPVSILKRLECHRLSSQTAVIGGRAEGCSSTTERSSEESTHTNTVVVPYVWQPWIYTTSNRSRDPVLKRAISVEEYYNNKVCEEVGECNMELVLDEPEEDDHGSSSVSVDNTVYQHKKYRYARESHRE